MSWSEADHVDYFRPPEPSFWRWEDGGLVASWSEGATIAFRLELLRVLQHLAPQGLPPLGSMLLVLAACRESWETLSNRAGLLGGLLAHSSITSLDSEVAADVSEHVQRWLAEAYEGLAQVHRLTRELNLGSEMEPELCAAIFQHSQRRTSPQAAAQLVETLQQGLSDTQLAPKPRDMVRLGAPLRLQQDLRCLAEAFADLTFEALRIRLQTGLDQAPRSAEVEAPPATFADWVDSLVEHAELGPMARMARQLMAVVSLPRRIDDVDELQVGGVSDITHRGPLDRLLLSELAYDETTLAARIATGEALYLRRESPPAHPPRRRHVLLDSGVRLWGAPRVLATAVGMALMATERSSAQVDVLRGNGPALVAVDLASEQGLLDHLAALDFRAHLGESLPVWQKRLAELDQQGDTLIVTSEEALADPEFERALKDAQFHAGHAATVHRSGRFRLLCRTRLGWTPVREATLSLDECFAPSEGKAPLVVDRAPDLPAFLRQHPLPLRSPGRLGVDYAWCVEDHGALSLASYGRLLHWTDPNYGGVELGHGLPLGKVLWAAPQANDGVAKAIIGRLSQQGMHVLEVNLTKGTCRVTPLQLRDPHPQTAFLHRGFAFVAYRKRLDVHNLANGELLASRRTSLEFWRGSRFARMSEGHWIAASYDGEQLLFLGVSSEPSIVAMFEAVGVEGPVAITRDGHVVYPDGRRIRIPNVRANVQVVNLSRDGRRISLKCGSDALWPLVFDLDAPNAVSHKSTSLEPELQKFGRDHTARNRLKGIGVSSIGDLFIVARNDFTWHLRFERGNQAYLLTREHGVGGTRDLIPFEHSPRWERTPYADLRIARWPGGSVAILDPRGLLHLRSAEGHVPECTIALNDRARTAGWTSEGQYWGPAFYIGQHQPTPIEEIRDRVIRPFVEALG